MIVIINIIIIIIIINLLLKIYMKNILIMKNLTDIRKTVETGVDSRWLSDLIPVIYPTLCANVKWMCCWPETMSLL